MTLAPRAGSTDSQSRPLSARMQEMLNLVLDLEVKYVGQGAMLDRTFDLHNDLTEWAVNTEHDDAALEVMAILEQYVAPRETMIALRNSDASTSPGALSPGTAG